MENLLLTAIVIKIENINDYDKKLVLLTKKDIIYALLKGVRKPKAKYKFIDLFTFAQFDLTSKGNIVKHCEIIEDLSKVVYDFNKFICVSLCAEIALNATKYSDCQEVFFLIVKFINEIIIEYEKNKLILIVKKFIQNLLIESGFCDKKDNDINYFLDLFEKEYECKLNSRKFFKSLYL